jgi:rubrerythrin
VIDVRRAAGEQWAFRALVEHDAARRFARLAEEVEALDADSPVPALLRAATADERRHAALCEGLVSAYGGSLRPLPAEVAIAPARLSRRDAVLYEIVAACCLTETESVATLTTLLHAEADPRVREVLHEIARDEVGHSRIGWAHLAREAERGEVAFLGPLIPGMLSGMIDPALFAPGSPEPDELLRHGVLPRDQKRETFVRALEDVILPGLARFGIDVAPAREWLQAALTTKRRI